MLRQWLHEHRAFLAAAPVALILGFAWPGWQAWHGNDQDPTEPVNVAKGEIAHYANADFRLKRLAIERAKPSVIGKTPPQDAVVVVAMFQGRLPDKKTAKDLFCSFHLQNADGWQWESGVRSGHYVPKGTSSQCNGSRYNKQFQKVYPKPGRWFDFAVPFTVPKSRAVGLRPTLEDHEEYPYYLRFGQ